MAYQGTVRRCLISSPSDVPEADLAVVHKTINHWNGIYGERYRSVIIPISWGSHARRSSDEVLKPSERATG